MERKRLGNTGETVPTIGMGTWKIGTGTSPEQRAREIDCLRRGIELGMNLIDTAEMYSNGGSEELVGEAIRGARDEVFVATKVSPDHLRHDDVITSCNGSLQRLSTDVIDLYQIHWPNPHVPLRETMRAMEQLVDLGKVRYIGVSNFDEQLLQLAREAMARHEIVSDQVEYSPRNTSAESQLIPYCIKERISVIAYSPLAKGRIEEGWIPQGLARKHGMTAAQAVLNWVTRSEPVVAIPKSSNWAHLEENARSVSVRFTEAEYAAIA